MKCELKAGKVWHPALFFGYLKAIKFDQIKSFNKVGILHYNRKRTCSLATFLDFRHIPQFSPSLSDFRIV